jgi:hypothetical protein
MLAFVEAPLALLLVHVLHDLPIAELSGPVFWLMTCRASMSKVCNSSLARYAQILQRVRAAYGG